MKYKTFKAYFKMPMYLQKFAESFEPEPAAGSSSGGSTAAPDVKDPELAPAASPKPLPFDDFLKESGNQAEFDRRVQKGDRYRCREK